MTRGVPGPWDSADYGGRPTCLKCFRPVTHCCCCLAPAFKAHCDILVLQHPNEWRKYYGTLKVLKSIVTNCQVLRGIDFELSVFNQLLAGRRPFILFPGAQSSKCEDVELGSNNVLVAIDGTWDEAKKILFRNQFLQAIPKLSFARQIISNYKIRKQPKDGCLSTIESVAHALLAIKGVQLNQGLMQNYQSLLEAFDRFVALQVQHWPKRDE